VLLCGPSQSKLQFFLWIFCSLANIAFFTELPRIFPNLYQSQLMLAVATTIYAKMEDEKQFLMTYFLPSYIRKVQNKQRETDKGTLYPVLGLAALTNATFKRPNPGLLADVFENVHLDVEPRVRYLQCYQTVFHAYQGDKSLMPGHGAPLSSECLLLIISNYEVRLTHSLFVLRV
jgi:hypothetical protein